MFQPRVRAKRANFNQSNLIYKYKFAYVLQICSCLLDFSLQEFALFARTRGGETCIRAQNYSTNSTRGQKLAKRCRTLRELAYAKPGAYWSYRCLVKCQVCPMAYIGRYSSHVQVSIQTTFVFRATNGKY